MKGIVWQPIVAGIVFGALAFLTIQTDLVITFPLGEGGAVYAVGLYGLFWFIGSALGGPVGGGIASVLAILCLIPKYTQGYGSGLAGLGMSYIYINLLMMTLANIFVGFAYAFIYKHMKMPARLAGWAVIVLFYYLGITIPISALNPFPAIPPVPYLTIARAFVPQIAADIVFTSMVWVALPPRYCKPLWIDPKPSSSLTEEPISQKKI